MDLFIIINDQILYKFEKNVISIKFVSIDSGSSEILEDHTSGFFIIKENSKLIIILNSGENKEFNIIGKNSILEVNRNIVKIISDKI